MSIVALPYNLADEIKVFPNEYINSITLNRGSLRLLYNDQQINENLKTLDVIVNPTSQNMFLVSYLDGATIKYKWYTQEEVKTTLGYANTTSDLSDVATTIPQAGFGLRWDSSELKYVLQYLPTKVSELTDVQFTSDLNDDDGLVWSEEYGKFINTPYLGTPRVGVSKIFYIEEDTWIKLPEIESYGDGAMVTVYKANTSSTVYISPGGSTDSLGTEANTKSLITNNSGEDSATIVLRAKITDTNKKWIIISGLGTWSYEDTSAIVETNIITLTYPDVLLAPFNIDSTLTYKRFTIDDSTILPDGIIDVSADSKWVGTRYEGHLIYEVTHNFLAIPHVSMYYINSENDSGFKELNSVTTILDDSNYLYKIYLDFDASEILFPWPPPSGKTAEIIISK